MNDLGTYSVRFYFVGIVLAGFNQFYTHWLADTAAVYTQRANGVPRLYYGHFSRGRILLKMIVIRQFIPQVLMNLVR